MLRKTDIDKVLRIWGPLTTAITTQSIELWRPLDLRSLADAYSALSGMPQAAKAPPRERADTGR